MGTSVPAKKRRRQGRPVEGVTELSEQDCLSKPNHNAPYFNGLGCIGTGPMARSSGRDMMGCGLATTQRCIRSIIEVESSHHSISKIAFVGWAWFDAADAVFPLDQSH